MRPDADTPEDDLIEACIAGDDLAWRELVRRYERLAYSIPRRHGLDPTAADEVFQEVFTALVRRLPSLRRRRALPKWIMSTAFRITLRWKERNARPRIQSEREERDASPPESLESWERRHELHVALDRLEPRCRDLLEALFRSPERPSYEHVAAQLGIPVGSIGPTRARCLQRLLDLMTRETPGDVYQEAGEPDLSSGDRA